MCGKVNKLTRFDPSLSELNVKLQNAINETELLMVGLSTKEQQIAGFKAQLTRMKEEMEQLGSRKMELSSISGQAIPEVEVILF